MQHDDIARDHLREVSSKYPSVLNIKMVAEILGEKCPAVRARIRRGTFQIPVQKNPGNLQHVLLVDMLKYLATGESRITLDVDHEGSRPKCNRRGRPRQN